MTERRISLEPFYKIIYHPDDRTSDEIALAIFWEVRDDIETEVNLIRDFVRYPVEDE